MTLRIDLPGSISAAFKPRTDSHPSGWQAEVAAYRVARGLGMHNVPPAIVRRILELLHAATLEIPELHGLAHQ